ncbi:MAG: alginate lyase family protein [Acidobacteriota bacterium]
MRSPSEIRFRVQQELANLWLFAAPPSWGEPLTGPLPGLPDPEAVAAAVRLSPNRQAYLQQVEGLADELLTHRFRLLGLEPVDLGSPIPWRRDFLHGQETGLDYFRRIPYLDFQRAGDHKVIWELNRHQHLVLLAQAFLLTGRREFLDEIPRQLDHWMLENPVQKGIHWASALEVAFRALSWLWVLHLVGKHLPEDFRRRWMRSLHHHGLHLEHNLSFYFSPNTHLLGEAVALDALGRLLPDMPRSAQWRSLGSKTVLEQMQRQVREDGSHFEQSSYYHLYSVDFFLFFLVLHPEAPEWYRGKLVKMVDFLSALVSSQGILPLIGDEDGGRFFHPYGERNRFAQATLVSCANLLQRTDWLPSHGGLELEQAVWWMASDSLDRSNRRAALLPDSSRWFADTGLAVLRSEKAHVILDAGNFGAGSAGHSHADTLSMVAFVDGRELLIDPGTFTYISDPAARQRFRGTAAHNTVSIDSLEQAVPQGPFRWTTPPQVELLHWDSTDSCDILDACCRYGGFTHRRSVVFQKPGILVVLDRVTGPAGSHRIEQGWLVPEGTEGSDFLATIPIASAEPAERSQALGSRQAATRWVARYEGELPANMVAVIHFNGDRPGKIETSTASEIDFVVQLESGEFHFPQQGPPRLVPHPMQQ